MELTQGRNPKDEAIIGQFRYWLLGFMWMESKMADFEAIIGLCFRCWLFDFRCGYFFGFSGPRCCHGAVWTGWENWKHLGAVVVGLQGNM